MCKTANDSTADFEFMTNSLIEQKVFFVTHKEFDLRKWYNQASGTCAMDSGISNRISK